MIITPDLLIQLAQVYNHIMACKKMLDIIKTTTNITQHLENKIHQVTSK